MGDKVVDVNNKVYEVHSAGKVYSNLAHEEGAGKVNELARKNGSAALFLKHPNNKLDLVGVFFTTSEERLNGRI